ncbi:MAG: hypothetical protein ACYDBP_15605 [Leptospirales bacterium]
MGPKRTTARVAPYLEAIDKARREGWTWKELAELFEVPWETLRYAVRNCRFQAEQRPLPNPKQENPEAAAPKGSSILIQNPTPTGNEKSGNRIPGLLDIPT